MEVITLTETQKKNDHVSRYDLNNIPNRGINMQLISGKAFFPMDPRAEEIEIEDIAHALALNNRYNGHTIFPVSVAQHSWNLSYVVDEGYELEALLHDRGESVYGDLIRPIKYLFPDFEKMENKFFKITANKFGVPETLSEHVMFHDVKICFTEKKYAMSENINVDWGAEMEPHDIVIEEWPWRKARDKFLERYYELRK